MNLALNAAEAIDDGVGTISISTERCDLKRIDLMDPPLLGLLRPGRYVQLQVIDSGCGMDAETSERIFEPFFSTKSTGFSTKSTGRGLGLAAIAVYGVHRSVVDAVIMDLSMPKLGGLDAASELRLVNPTLPLIFSSGYPEDELLQRFPLDEITAFAAKPYDASTLLELIQSLCARR